jgi:LacI family transcriptional regulator
VIVCANDEVALGALTAAGEAGLRVPADVAVTGWDDVMAARFAGLTTVGQPMRELGATAARRLHDLILRRAAGRTASRRAGREETLPTRLVVRTSCGEHVTK